MHTFIFMTGVVTLTLMEWMIAWYLVKNLGTLHPVGKLQAIPRILIVFVQWLLILYVMVKVEPRELGTLLKYGDAVFSIALSLRLNAYVGIKMGYLSQNEPRAFVPIRHRDEMN